MKPTAQTPLELYDLKADEITAHILGYLRAKGYVCWAQDNRGRYNPRTGKWYPHPNNRVGVPDILGYRCADARFLAVEVKAGRDQLSSFQIDFLDELKANGGLAFVARDFAGFVQSFERRGLHLPTMATPAAPTEPVPAAGPGHPPRAAPTGPTVAAAPLTPPVPAAPASPTGAHCSTTPPPPTSLPGLPTTHDEPAPYHAQNTRHR